MQPMSTTAPNSAPCSPCWYTRNFHFVVWCNPCHPQPQILHRAENPQHCQTVFVTGAPAEGGGGEGWEGIREGGRDRGRERASLWPHRIHLQISTALLSESSEDRSTSERLPSSSASAV